MEVNLVFEGVKAMVLGMSVVFSFLLLLVGVLQLQAKIIGKYFPDPQQPACDLKPTKNTTSSNDDIVAVITAAVTHFRKTNS